MGLSSTEVCRPQLCILHEIHCVTMCHTLKCLGRPLTSFDLLRSAATICNSKNSHISTIMITSHRPVQSAKIVTLFWIRATFVVRFMVGFGCLSVKHAAGILSLSRRKRHESKLCAQVTHAMNQILKTVTSLAEAAKHFFFDL